MRYLEGNGSEVRNHRREAAFTLIELMIAVAILAIIVAVAIPSYTNFVTRSNLAEGKTLVMNAAQALERCYTRFSSYENCNIGLPLESENGWYQITADSVDLGATTFEISAVPQGVQATRDSKCGEFILNERGQRDVSLADGDQSIVKECW